MLALCLQSHCLWTCLEMVQRILSGVTKVERAPSWRGPRSGFIPELSGFSTVLRGPPAVRPPRTAGDARAWVTRLRILLLR